MRSLTLSPANRAKFTMTNDREERITFERLSDSLGFRVNYLARLMRSELEFRIKPFGLNGTTWPVMVALYEQDGQSQSDIGDRTGMDAPTMTRALDNLEARRYIDRYRDDHDRRVQLILLTREGRSVAIRAAQIGEEINRETVQLLSEEEREILWSSVSRIETALKSLIEKRVDYYADEASRV